jgi:hypothetical protein
MSGWRRCRSTVRWRAVRPSRPAALAHMTRPLPDGRCAGHPTPRPGAALCGQVEAPSRRGWIGSRHSGGPANRTAAHAAHATSAPRRRRQTVACEHVHSARRDERAVVRPAQRGSARRAWPGGRVAGQTTPQPQGSSVHHRGRQSEAAGPQGTTLAEGRPTPSRAESGCAAARSARRWLTHTDRRNDVLHLHRQRWRDSSYVARLTPRQGAAPGGRTRTLCAGRRCAPTLPARARSTPTGHRGPAV